jgi:peroxiredoxin
MVQLRQDYEQFLQRDAEVVVVGAEKPRAFATYWENESLPFVGLPDPKHTVLKQYGQEVKIFRFGRMPAQVIVDREGLIRYVHYGHDQADIPSNKELLAILDELNAGATRR